MKIKSARILTELILPALGFLLSALSCLATSYTWNGGSGDWSVAGNWTPNGVPGASDTATVNSGGVTLNADTTAGTLNLGGGTLNGSGTLTVNGTLTWTAGVMSGAGRTVIAGGATLNVSNPGAITLSVRTLENGGTVNWNGSGVFSTDSGAVITNRVGALFVAQSDTVLQYAGGATTRFDNAGTFRKAVSTGTTTFVMPFNNYGANEVRTGTLLCNITFSNYGRVDVAAGATNRLAGGGDASGPFDVANGGLVDFSASTYNLNAGVQLTGTGHHRISGGTVSVTAGVPVQHLELSGGTLTGSGTLTVNGTMNWTAGIMAGAAGTARTVIAEGATLNINNPGTILLSVRALENAGTVNWNGGGVFNTDTSAVITNRMGALFVAQSDAVIQYAGGAATRFDNAGIFRKTAGSGTTTLALTFNNYGTVDVQSGVLLPLSTFNVFGTVTVAALARVDFTAGTYNLQSGAQLIGAGLHRLSGGTWSVNGGVVVQNLELSSGTVNGSGTLTVNGTMTWTAGVMSGTGRTVIAEGATLNVSNPGPITLSVRALENAGTVNWTGSGVFNTDTSAVITNRVGALFVAQSDTVLQNSGGAAPRFDNAGIFRKTSGTATTTLALPFNNYGTNEVQTGTLLCNTTFNNDNWVDVAAGATNRLAGGGAASGTFDVASGGLVDISAANYNLGAGAQLIGAGLHRISGGTLSVNGSAVAENLAFSSGTLNGSGTLTISNVMTWTAGLMSGAGRTVIAEGGTLNVSNPGTITLSVRALENAGTVNWNGSGLFNTDTGAVITNRVGALFVAQSDTVLQYAGGTACRFDNAGIFRKAAGTGTTTLSLPFNNNGTVDLPIGFVAFNSGYFSANVSVIAVPISGTTVGTGFGRMQVSGGVTLAGTLATTLENGFYPGTNALFTFLTAGSVSGTFANFFFPSNDVGMKVTYAANSAAIEVINVRPVLDPISDKTNAELVPFIHTATAHDDDRPAQTLRFTLTNSPANASINPTSGRITWTPSEAEGPMITNITVRVTDNGTPNLTVSRTFQIVVNEINVAPVLGPLSNYTVNAGQTVSFTATATDSDVPTNTLMFSLLSPPAGATITSGGLFNWRPGVALANTTNVLQVMVQDNGAPVSNDTRSFTVVVNPLAASVMLTPLGYANGQFTIGVTGPHGPDYVIMGSTNLQQWSDLTTNLSPILPFQQTDPVAGSFSNRAYRVRLQP
jgi:hypothetical protein